MEGRKGTERNRSVGEGVCVAIAVEEGIDSGKTAWRAFHGIVGRHDAVDELVPCAGSGQTEY